MEFTTADKVRVLAAPLSTTLPTTNEGLGPTQADLLFTWFKCYQTEVACADAADHQLACRVLTSEWPTHLAALFSPSLGALPLVNPRAVAECRITNPETHKLIRKPDVAALDHFGRVHLFEVTREIRKSKKHREKRGQIEDQVIALAAQFGVITSITGWIAHFRYIHVGRYSYPSYQQIKFSFEHVLTA